MSFRSLKKKSTYDGPKLEDIEDSNVSPRLQKQLAFYFAGIEAEFAQVCQENEQLKSKLRQLERQISLKNHVDSKEHSTKESFPDVDGPWQNLPRNASQFSKKVMIKYKEQTNKIVSTFRPPHVSVNIKHIGRFSGHKDGIWDVSYCKGLKGRPIIGTASNDRTARVWQAEGQQCCLLKYLGHSGSVNSIRFHPTLPLVLTGSGDRSAQIWCCDVPESDIVYSETQPHNSDEDFSDPEEAERDQNVASVVVRTPQKTLTGHNNAVTAAEWLSGGTQCVTASWDRTARIWDSEAGTAIHSLTGHDQEITDTSVHSSQALIVTCSKDTTFRVWDFRTSIHSVNVYQGHTASVTCAVFTTHHDSIVSGSDDCTVKVWDLRNMRTAISTIQCDASVNKLAISDESHHTIAIPFDNRHVRLYDLQGTYLTRLPRRSQPGHQRMVCSATWASDDNAANLFTCGFDNRTIAWKITVDHDSHR
ncbi:hypothetical protein ACHWQZ_G012315 [Mnemiopsis leidyi]